MLENSPSCGALTLTAEECKDVANELEFGFKIMSKGHAPNGCHLDTKFGKLRVWWNEEYPGTYGQPKYKSICKKALKENDGKMNKFRRNV